MNGEKIPQIAPELIWRFLDDNAVLVSPQGGKVRVLNGLGTIIWKMLAEKESPQTIHEHIVAHFDVTPEQASQDLEQFLQELTDRGLLVW